MLQQLKSLAGRVYHQKKWIERWRYRGRSILAGQAGNDLMRAQIEAGPCAVGKIGESELRGVLSYLEHRNADGSCDTWSKRADRLYFNAGVFPHTAEAFTAFAKEFLDALSEIDTLAVWFNSGEARCVNQHSPNAKLVSLQAIEPHLWDRPWYELLQGKRLLAISPFTTTIEQQHERRKEIWASKPVMAPDYELATLQTPLAAVLADSPYASWQEGLDDLRRRMDETDFDVAVIGVGAWSLPLAVHAKRLGKAGVHLGGATQLLFGIRGRRWELKPKHSRYFNEHWVRPSADESPDTAKKIEGGCYW